MNTELLAQNNITWTLCDNKYTASYKSSGQLIVENISPEQWDTFVAGFEVGHTIGVQKPARIIREDPLESLTDDVEIAIEDREEEISQLKNLRERIENYDDGLSDIRREFEDIV